MPNRHGSIQRRGKRSGPSFPFPKANFEARLARARPKIPFPSVMKFAKRQFVNAIIENLMTRPRLLLFFSAIALILLGLGAASGGISSAPMRSIAAELVPPQTPSFFATIPNGATLLEGYPDVQGENAARFPQCKPLRDAIVNVIGQKNVGLIRPFLPNLKRVNRSSPSLTFDL